MVSIFALGICFSPYKKENKKMYNTSVDPKKDADTLAPRKEAAKMTWPDLDAAWCSQLLTETDGSLEKKNLARAVIIEMDGNTGKVPHARLRNNNL
jgi:hypothetical protein